MQRSLWTSQRLSPESPVQNMALVSHIDGPVDGERLARAFERVVAGSDVLQTRLVRRTTADGETTESAELTLLDGDPGPLSELIECSRSDILKLARRRVATPLDMSVRGFESVVASHADGTCSWFLNVHHVLTDATSSALVFDAVAAAYHGHEPDANSYYNWVERLLGNGEVDAGSKAMQRSVEHWRSRPAAPALDGLYRPDPAKSRSAEASRHSLNLSSTVLAACDERLTSDYRMLSPDLGWTVLLVAATALYVHRVTGSTDFSIGLPVHHRGHPDTKNLIGPTMEVFPVDIAIELGDTHRRFHNRVGRSVIETLQNALPGTSPAPDFQAVVNVIPRAEQNTFGPFPTSTEWIHSGAIDASHLLRVQMTRYSDGDGYQFALDVNERVADDQQRIRAAHHLETVIGQLVEDPDAAVGGYNLVTGDEQKILDAWGCREPHGETANETATDPATTFDGPTESLRRLEPVIGPLLTRLAANAEPVIDHDGRTITGSELAEWITTTAHWLVSQRVEPGDRVAVKLPRSPEAVVAIAAILSAGGSFVPLDPEQPEARLDRLVERAGCRMVLSSVEELAELAPRRSTAPPAITRRPRPVVERRPDDEAYLLFTSGSTGEPKGVPISHRGLTGYLEFATRTYIAEGEHVRTALFSALTFDLTITTLFAPLLTGGQLVIIDQSGLAGLTAIASRTDITWLKATPSHLELLVRLLPADHGLRTLVVGGEAFGTALADNLAAFNPDARIFNEYGPTEAVVGCMEYLVEPGLATTQAALGSDAVPIGRPSPGVTLRILDQYLQPVPVGSPGELVISHDGLSIGYLDGDGEDSPFIELDGRRFYRSGDLVRLQDSETLVYLGRIDEQVKVGGIRLEPIEVEQALNRHPAVERSAVRVWSPAADAREAAKPDNHCVRCGLPDNVPGAEFDINGVCATCHAYDQVAPVAERWFKNSDDLRAELAWARRNRTGDHDVLHLLSGGKDSTFALYQLVEHGARPYVLTLDNGFISEGAKDNCRSSVADLGLDHEFVTTDAMNAIFADSLATYSNVCNGCYKAIYTLATTRADQLGIPMIVTGLSRGQLFETRLIPQQFTLDRFDPAAIDRAVIEARKVYHRTPDAATRLLDTEVFDDDAVFDRIRYLDFYRYMDVELAEMLDFLNNRAPWVRPADTGRSTNCLVNAAGIHTHLAEQGYHNYAIPYAWDVRLGHKTRDEAIEELDDELDLDDVNSMLAEIGYEPRRRQILTAWIERAELSPGLDPAELRAFLSGELPDYAIPSAFVALDALPLTPNGKLDAAALPAPERVHRPSVGVFVAAGSETERAVVEVWERILGVEPVSIDDDFFALGGDSLAALEMIVAVGERLGTGTAEDLAFRHTTPRRLAAAIDALAVEAAGAEHQDRFVGQVGSPPPPSAIDEVPVLSDGERAVLFDQGQRPDDVMYNVGRAYLLDALDLSGGADTPAPIRPDALRAALEEVVARHQPLSWTYGAPRRRLKPAEALEFSVGAKIEADEVDAVLADSHRRPFDLANGPLLRCHVQPVVDGSAQILLVIHHASGDADSFAIIWSEVNAILAGGRLPELVTDYGGFCRWQRRTYADGDREFWLSQADSTPAPGRLATVNGRPVADGYLKQVASVTSDDLAATEGVTPFAVALAGITSALSDYWTNDVIDVGLITSARNHRSADGLVGYFLNTVPLTVDLEAQRPADGAESAGDIGALAQAISQHLGNILAHRSYPLARILSDRSAAGLSAAAPTVYVAYDELTTTDVGGITATPTVLSNGSAVADATIFVERRAGHIDLSLEYRGSVFTPEAAQALLNTVDRRITAAATDPRSAVVEPPPIRSGATGSLLVGAELPLPQSPAGRPVIDRIVERLNRAVNDEAVGGNEAVRCGDQRLSWRQLAERSAAVAERLQAAGVGSGDRVLVATPRSVELPVAVAAVLRAGGVYVPVDPTYPDQRLAMLVAAAGAKAAVVGPDPAATPEAITGADAAMTVIAVTGETTPDAVPESTVVDADDPAYLIFTSGSTGVPKPVEINHEQLSASTNARSVFYGPPRGTNGDDLFGFLMLSSISFDSSIVGLMWTLADGGTLVLPTDDQVHDIDALAELLGDPAVTHTLLVPTLYGAVVAAQKRSRSGSGPVAGGGAQWPCQVIVAGEACPATLVVDHYRSFPASRLTNEYGPTETSVWITACHVEPSDDPVPIGGPIPGAWSAVVGTDGRLRPAGVAGELVVGGPGVASEYGMPVEQLGPWAAGLAGRAYRTGDRVVAHDGKLDFLGRIDNQLNVNGVRVEPEEIENAVMSVDSVAAAVVVASERITTTGASVAELVAHVELNEGRTTTDTSDDTESETETVDAIRRAVAAQMPDRSRPARYIVQRELPRSPNGKIDRAAAADLAVPAPNLGVNIDVSADMASVPGDPDGEQQLAAVFAATLGRPDLDPATSFFDVGGHSLLAVDLVMNIEKATGLRVPVATLYRSPSARELAAAIAETGDTANSTTADSTADRTADTPEMTTADAGTDVSLLIPIQPYGDRPPIFAIHVLGVDCAFFRPLAAELGDSQPMYGLGQPRSDTELDTEVTSDVTEVAATYVRHIVDVAPAGPVVLAAISLGGVVAYEAAQQLTAAGREVRLLVMLDSFGPDANLGRSMADKLRYHAQSLRSGPRQYLAGRLDHEGRRLQRWAELAEMKTRERLSLPSNHRVEVRRYIEENIGNQTSYQYRPYSGDVLAYKAAEEPSTEAQVANQMGWGRVVEGSLEVNVTGGHHHTMMMSPHVSALARSLKARLDR